eukprot:GDKJ01026253.1.p1 GENE.GDKJ01026253.1~~GDKJ01026253.1.p1  ORF type:complete len:118 (+),score=23.70 GDKJ01026253.1:31-354(+)
MSHHSLQLKSNPSITVSPGEVFHVEVDGNPTTGYTWVHNGPACVHLQDTIVTPASRERIGGGSHFTYVFSADNTCQGLQSVQFNYVRPWLADEPAETHHVSVTVRGP